MGIKHTFLAAVISLGLNSLVIAEELELNPDHPTRYVVMKGDTLWDISAKFLRDPWRWPELWNLNPEINNPHLIYPGDAISLVFKDGKPTLQIERGTQVVKLSPAEGDTGTATHSVKLSPTARATPVTQAIPTVASDVIAQFLGRPSVLSKETVDNAGYLAAAEDAHLIVGTGAKVFARKLPASDSSNFAVYHIGQAYTDPNDKKRILGYEALHVADLTLIERGEPNTLRISKAYREVLNGDKVLPANLIQPEQNFVPRAPAANIKGEIISVLDGLWRAGRYQSVVLNRGTKDGLGPGHVLAIYQSGITVRDKQANHDQEMTLPDTRAGLIMVYRSFDNVSYALIMNTTRDIRAGDAVTNP